MTGTRVPKYWLVKEELLRLIAEGAPGSALPTERDLAERLATSRTTVRQAIAELVVEGRLERTQGSGTYIAEPKLVHVRQLTSFTEDLGPQRVQNRVLDVRREVPSAAVAERLGLATGGAGAPGGADADRRRRPARARVGGARRRPARPAGRARAPRLALRDAARCVRDRGRRGRGRGADAAWPTRRRPHTSTWRPGIRCCWCTGWPAIRRAGPSSGPARCSAATGSASWPAPAGDGEPVRATPARGGGGAAVRHARRNVEGRSRCAIGQDPVAPVVRSPPDSNTCRDSGVVDRGR